MTVTTRVMQHAVMYSHLPNVGIVAVDVHDEAMLDTLVRNADIVINLVGTWYSSRGRGRRPYGRQYAKVHVQLTQKVIAACIRHGGKRYIHLSAYGASEAQTALLHSKADGEAEVLRHPELDATIIRPSVMFGRGDTLLRLMALMYNSIAFVPFADAQLQFQPVFVEDVASVILYSLENQGTIGEILTIVGPHVYTVSDLVSMVGECAGRKKSIRQWPERLAYFQRMFLPKVCLSQGNLVLLQQANQTMDPLTAESFAASYGISLTPLESVFAGCLVQPQEVPSAA